MNDNAQYALYTIGVLAIIYLVFRYIIPFLLRFIAGALGIFMQVLLIVLVLFGIFWVIGYLSKSSKS